MIRRWFGGKKPSQGADEDSSEVVVAVDDVAEPIPAAPAPEAAIPVAPPIPESPVISEPAAAESSVAEIPEEPSGLWSRLRQGLSKSRQGLQQALGGVFARSRLDEEFWEELEEALIASDAGVETTMKLVDGLRQRVRDERITEPHEVRAALVDAIAGLLTPAPDLFSGSGVRAVIVVGVNGTGKTTTIAKLAKLRSSLGDRTLLAAADTFRAAAIEQLTMWGERVGVDIIAHEREADPSAVVFDAVRASIARKTDVLLVDTAGRLHTYENLMGELEKMKRVALREMGDAGVVRVLLVLDASTGQNGLIQAGRFTESVSVDAICLTKLDGTAKGGVALAIQETLGIPIAYVGVGEGYEDLQHFDPRLFASALLGSEAELDLVEGD